MNWTEEEKERLYTLKEKGYTRKQIATELGRAESSIHGCIARINLKRRVGNDSRLNELEKENERLRKILVWTGKNQHIKLKYDCEYARIGVVSDTQLCSLFENTELLKNAYDVFEKEGVTAVYHCGDLLDAEKMYTGHEYELHTIGCDNQIQYTIETYPKKENITTYFITGNHDQRYWKLVGANIGPKITDKRPDLIYVGRTKADTELQTKDGCVWLRLAHPTKGTAYAVSYQPQKYVESLTGGYKPNILILGHYHKAEFLPIRNIAVLQAGCCQHQTIFMEERNIAAIQGFWIIEAMLDGESVSRFKTEWFPCY